MKLTYEENGSVKEWAPAAKKRYEAAMNRAVTASWLEAREKAKWEAAAETSRNARKEAIAAMQAWDVAKIDARAAADIDARARSGENA